MSYQKVPRRKSPNPVSGFGSIELVFVIGVVCIVSLVGWYAFHKSKPPPVVPAAQAKPAANPYIGWKTYSNTALHISFQYPPGWLVGSDGMTGVSVSNVVSPLAVQRTGQQADSAYNNDTVASISYIPQYTPYLPTDSDIVQTNFLINHNNYCLIALHNFSVKGDPVISVSVNDCKANDSLSWTSAVPVAKGVIEINIISAGNGLATTVPLAVSSISYTTILTILHSITFP